MATIHEFLYESGNFSNLNFSEIVEKLVFNLEKVLGGDKKIEHQINCQKIELNINQAIPCSVMINEIVTNIYKHAFTGREDGVVSVGLTLQDDEVTVKIANLSISIKEQQ